MRCAGSIREEAKYPPDPGNKYSIDGTHTHTLLEKCIQSDLADPKQFLGIKMEDHEGVFDVDADRVARVSMAMDYVKQRLMDLKPCAIRAEEKVNPGAWVNRSDLNGTADIQLIAERVLEIIDYKDGVGEVTDTYQRLLYALGALYNYIPPDGPNNLPFETVRITIIQPKLAEMGKEPINFIDMSLDEIFKWAESLGEKCAATDDPEAPLVPGEIQCKWCRARGSCEAQATQALATAQVLFDKVDMVTQAADQEVNVIPDDKFVEIVLALPLLKQFIKDIDAEGLRRHEAGQLPEGLKVVKGRGSNVWALSEEETAAKLKGMGIPKDHVFPAKLVSPAQARKVKWVNRKKEPKSLSPRQLKGLEELISKLDGKPHVVPESDSRPSVTKDAKTLFSDVTVETEVPVKNPPPAMPAWLT